MYNTKPTCFWCKKTIGKPDKIFILGAVDGQPTQINFHPSCAVNASIKMLSRVEFVTKKENASVILKYRGE
jgi:hypothetical protein